MSNERKLSRRKFLGTTLAAAVLAPVAGRGLIHDAQAGEMATVPLDDPTAVALGYVEDAAKTDTAKFPKRAGEAGAKQFCSNCSLYQAVEDGEWGKCSIFQNRLVKGAGWYNAWIAKA